MHFLQLFYLSHMNASHKSLPQLVLKLSNSSSMDSKQNTNKSTRNQTQSYREQSGGGQRWGMEEAKWVKGINRHKLPVKR